MTDQLHLVAADDGRWVTSWLDAETAAIVAATRRRLEAFPHSPDTFRGEPCWLVPEQKNEPYPRLRVAKTLAPLMGLGQAEKRKFAKAHRISFFVYHGHRPLNGTVDHACDRKRCVNPAHLDDLTYDANQARRDPWANWQPPARTLTTTPPGSYS
jgi:hypothetical protein